MNRFYQLIFVTLLLLLIGTLTISEAQVKGLIIDKTKTKIGRDFYEIFYITLEPVMATDAKFDLVVEEFMDPQFGSRISIYINDNIIYQNFVSSRFDDIEEKVKEASEVVKYFIYNWKEYEKYLEEEGKIR